jgi:hypothetical protein
MPITLGVEHAGLSSSARQAFLFGSGSVVSNLTLSFNKMRFFVMAGTAGLDFCDGQHCGSGPLRLF